LGVKNRREGEDSARGSQKGAAGKGHECANSGVRLRIDESTIDRAFPQLTTREAYRILVGEML